MPESGTRGWGRAGHGGHPRQSWGSWTELGGEWAGVGGTRKAGGDNASWPHGRGVPALAPRGWGWEQ